jgi:3-oxoadipate enol-lactonase
VRPDATIRYWTGGASGGQVVVLLHGATLDHRAWSPQVEALQARFRLVVPDLRAHGESTGSFDFEAALHDVLALLGEVPAGRVVLVGLSLGGNLAQEVVRRAPERVAAIVVADATCNTGARHPLATSMTVAALSAHAMLPGDHFARYAAQMVALNPQVQRYALDANGNRSNRETVRILTSLLTGALRPEQDYRLPVPALLVHGQLDQLGERRAVERTVPFGLICFSMVTVWYTLHGHAPDDVTGHRTRARWYTTKTEPSYDDMAVKLRRVIIAARFRSPCPEQASPQETRAVLAAWAAAGT